MVDDILNQLAELADALSTDLAAELAGELEAIALEDDAVASLEDEFKRRGAALEARKAAAAEMMQANGVASIKLASGLAPRVRPVTKYYLKDGDKSLRMDDQDVIDALRARGYGRVVREQVGSWSALQAVCKEMDAAGELPPWASRSDSLTLTLSGKAKFIRGRGDT